MSYVSNFTGTQIDAAVTIVNSKEDTWDGAASTVTAGATDWDAAVTTVTTKEDTWDAKLDIPSIAAVTTATHTTTTADKIIHVSYTDTGAATITLASACATSGNIITIKDAGGNAGTNNITIDCEGSETIDGATSQTIDADYGVLSVYSNGTNWFVM